MADEEAEDAGADAGGDGEDLTVIDATDLVLGRLCTDVAKRLLNGETVRIVHAEKAIISGDRREIVARYKEKRELGTSRKGPFRPRTPDRILKRTVRGMLPYQKPRGREAYKRLRVYMGVPDDLAEAAATAETVEDAGGERLVSFITLAELSRGLGYEVKVET